MSKKKTENEGASSKDEKFRSPNLDTIEVTVETH